MDVSSIKDLAIVTDMSLVKREEITANIEFVRKEIAELDKKLEDIQDGLDAYDALGASQNVNQLRGIVDAYGTQSDLQEGYDALVNTRDAYSNLLTKLNAALDNYRNFDKSICFSNIRLLLKQNSDVKIGQIEKDAGVRLGYMARLEKPENTSEPSIEFVVTAAKFLGVGLDTLLLVDLSGLTPTEQYLVSFIDKLKKDTISDKLDWNKESANSLNRMESDINGYVQHGLFSSETFYEQSEGGYPEEVSRVVFVSETFGPETYINGDCYNLRLKNGSNLYLMDICRSAQRVGDGVAYAKEAWMYTPNVGKQFLFSDRDGSALAPLVETLFEIVSERNKRPRIKKEIKYVIDAFMQDDIGDDEADDTMLFN